MFVKGRGAGKTKRRWVRKNKELWFNCHLGLDYYQPIA
jgi:hypothetical protein